MVSNSSTKMVRDASFEALIGLGLSENEARVYLGLLRVGTSTVAQIARASILKRSTAYTVLESLSARGFVALAPKGRVRTYAASHPEVLSEIVGDRLSRFQNYLPELISLFNLKGAAGTTRVFEGKVAARQPYEMLLKAASPKDPYLIMSDIEKWSRLDPAFTKSFVQRRADLGIKPRHLFIESKLARPRLDALRKLGGDGRILPPHISFSINLVIIPSMVVIHQLVDPLYAVVIESPVIAEMLAQIWEVVWQVTPPYFAR